MISVLKCASRLFKNSRGVIHVISVIATAVIVFAVIGYYNRYVNSGISHRPQSISATDITSGISIDDVSSALSSMDVNMVRQTAYAIVDLKGRILKARVDMALSSWESMTPEQRRQVREQIMTLAKNRFD